MYLNSFTGFRIINREYSLNMFLFNLVFFRVEFTYLQIAKCHLYEVSSSLHAICTTGVQDKKPSLGKKSKLGCLSNCT
jgi:hypothetical protein